MNTVQVASSFALRVRTNAQYAYRALQIVEDEIALPAIDSALCAGLAVYEALTSDRARAGYRLCRYVGAECFTIFKMIAVLCYYAGQDLRALCDLYVESCQQPAEVAPEAIKKPAEPDTTPEPVTANKVPGSNKWSYKRTLRPSEREKVLALAV